MHIVNNLYYRVLLEMCVTSVDIDTSLKLIVVRILGLPMFGSQSQCECRGILGIKRIKTHFDQSMKS
jgi:hypothetical protein